MQDNTSINIMTNPRLIQLLKRIAGPCQELYLTPEEVTDIVNSGYRLFFGSLIHKNGKKFITMTGKNGQGEFFHNCQESALTNAGLKLFDRYQTDKGRATFLGMYNNFLGFVVDGDAGCSYWNDLSTIKDLQKKYFIVINHHDLNCSGLEADEQIFIKKVVGNNNDVHIYTNPKLRNIFKKIGSTASLTLKPSEITTLVEYGYLSTFKDLLFSKGIKLLRIKDNQKNFDHQVFECSAGKFSPSGIEILNRYRTPDCLISSKALFTNKIAIVVGFKTTNSSYKSIFHEKTGAYLLIDEKVTFWEAGNSSDLQDYGFIKLDEHPMQTVEMKHVSFLGKKALRELKTPEQRFLHRLISEITSGEVATVANMLQCLVNRYKNQKLDIVVLPTDKKIIRLLLQLVDANKRNFKFFEVLYSYFCRTKEQIDEASWKYVFKQCLLQAVDLNDSEIVKLLTERNPITYPLSANDFSPNELQEMARLVLLPEKEPILSVLITNGFYDSTHINQMLTEGKARSQLLQKAQKFYQDLFLEEKNLKILNAFLILLNDALHGLTMMQMFQNVIESIPALEVDVNLSIIKKLILQLHLCFDEDHGAKYDQYQLILTQLFTLDFDEIKNKSLFKNNKERDDFFQQHLSGANFVLDRTNNNNNNVSSASLYEKYKGEADLIPSDQAPKIILQELNILMHDFQDYQMLIEELKQIPADKLGMQAKAVLEGYAKSVPAEFKMAIYTKIAEIIALTDGAVAKEYLLKATLNLDNRQSMQLTQFSPLLNNNNAQENRESLKNEQTISNSSV